MGAIYVFHATGPNWRAVNNDDWSITVVDQDLAQSIVTNRFLHVGRRTIDGSECHVFLLHNYPVDSEWIAMTTPAYQSLKEAVLQ